MKIITLMEIHDLWFKLHHRGYNLTVWDIFQRYLQPNKAFKTHEFGLFCDAFRASGFIIY
jgi:hypothetical protein